MGNPGYTTLAIHFHHTCYQNSKKAHICISKCSGCCHLHKDGLTNIDDLSLTDHSISNNRDISYDGICLACLYSATAKWLVFIQLRQNPLRQILSRLYYQFRHLCLPRFHQNQVLPSGLNGCLQYRCEHLRQPFPNSFTGWTAPS